MIEFVIITIFLVLFALGTSQKRRNARFLEISFLFFLILAAFRASYIGNDTQAYIDIFQEITLSDELTDYGRFEPGFVLLCNIIAYYTKEPQALIIVSSIISYVAFYWIIKRYCSFYQVAVLLFFTCGLFRFSLSAIRQCIAIAILVFGFIYITSSRKNTRSDVLFCYKDVLRFSPFLIVASFFHISAIITGILLFVSLYSWRKWYYAIVMLFCLVGSSFLQIVISDFSVGDMGYSRYIGSKYDDGLNIASIFLTLMCLVDYLIISYSSCKELRFFKQVVFVKLCLLVLSFNLNAIDRLADTFTIFEIVGVANALNYYKKGTQSILISGVVLMYFSYSMVWGIYRPSIQMLWPYHFFWE